MHTSQVSAQSRHCPAAGSAFSAYLDRSCAPAPGRSLFLCKLLTAETDITGSAVQHIKAEPAIYFTAAKLEEAHFSQQAEEAIKAAAGACPALPWPPAQCTTILGLQDHFPEFRQLNVEDRPGWARCIQPLLMSVWFSPAAMNLASLVVMHLCVSALMSCSSRQRLESTAPITQKQQLHHPVCS